MKDARTSAGRRMRNGEAAPAWGPGSVPYKCSYFSPAGRTWGGGCSVVSSELPEVGPDPKQQLGNGEEETGKDRICARKPNLIQITRC